MGVERDDLDMIRSEGEGFGLGHPESFESGGKDKKLNLFLQKLVDAFLEDGVSDIEGTAIDVLKSFSKEEKEEALEISKKHFLPSVCHEHEIDIANDENYVENSGGASEGPIIDWELTVGNLGRFLVLEGSQSVRAHIKHMVGSTEWSRLEGIEAERILFYDQTRGGTAG